MKHSCPACCYAALTEAPRSKSGGASYEICPCCGFQSGVDDDDRHITPGQWRKQWIQAGMKWTSKSISSPPAWNAATQLKVSRPRQA
jgi:hypothetical protein